MLDAQTELPSVRPGPFPGRPVPPLVALGGSDGGREALATFFRALPADTGMAYVVMLQPAPEQEDGLADCLARATAMPVVPVRRIEHLAPDHIYLGAPGHGLKALDGSLAAVSLPTLRSRQAAVDQLLRSVADSHGPQATAILLSGTDGEGSAGVKRIKERGGLTIVQDPVEAAHASAPSRAIATGMVDWVLPVAEMPQRLLDYHRHAEHVRLPSEEPPRPHPLPECAVADEALLHDVLALLRHRGGRDLSQYKRATLLRRIGRRMQVNGAGDLAGYLECLRTRPGEAGALLQDLLISVTHFFRDTECFDALAAHLPALLAGRTHNDTVRVWVPACATGEEAYSIAMLLSEQARALDDPPTVQVFATDLSEDVIRTAREGLYPSAIEADVSEERLRRFFVKDPRGWRVGAEVREMVLFAQHDLMADSPFSRLDLVSCRNLLIYLTPEAQSRALSLFQFSLRPGGLLFLGASESIEDTGVSFVVLDRAHRLYQQPAGPRPRLPLPPSATPPRGDAATAGLRAASAAAAARAPKAPPALRDVRGGASDRAASAWGEAHLRLLEHLAPPSVLVDAEHEMLHLSAAAGRFLHFGGGEPSRNLLRVVHPALRLDLRAALAEAAMSGVPVQVERIAVELPDGPDEVTLRVLPAPDVAPDALLVLFDSQAPGTADHPPGAHGRAPAATAMAPDPLAHRLDREVERLKARLRDTVEQYEASTEELKANNEELHAMNEELRSATEELETSREELQAINEELTTVNQELKGKVEELGRANSDLQNLMDATDIATVFLDRELRIMRFTPAAAPLFHLIAGDVGRPITDLTTQLSYPQLQDDAHQVLDTLEPLARSVSERGGRCHQARLRPYRTQDDRIAGLVLTLVDLGERGPAEPD